MLSKTVITILLIIYRISVNADQLNETEQYDILKNVDEQIVIKLPWQDCVNFNNSSTTKLSFSEKQIKKENKVHKKYEKHYLEHDKLINFSTKQEVEHKTNFVIPNFLSNQENYYNKTTMPETHFRRQEQFLNKMKYLDNKMHHKKKHKYDTDMIYLPIFKSE